MAPHAPYDDVVHNAQAFRAVRLPDDLKDSSSSFIARKLRKYKQNEENVCAFKKSKIRSYYELYFVNCFFFFLM